MKAFDRSKVHWEVPLGLSGRIAELDLPKDFGHDDADLLSAFLHDLANRPVMGG